MNDLRRLLDEAPGDLELELLHAAQEDAPPAASMWKAAAALGVGAAATAKIGLGSSAALASVAGETAPSAGAAVAQGTAVGAAKGASLSLAMFAKPLVVGLVAGLAASAGVHYTSTPSEPAARVDDADGRARVAVTAPTPRAQRTGEAPKAPPLEDAAELPPNDLPPAPPSAPAKLVTRRAATPAAPTAPVAPEQAPTAAFTAPEEAPKPAARSEAPARSLAPEIALLDRARSALVANDARGALAALDTYDGAPRSGVFEPEARVLRIQARLKLGDRAGAARLARAFIQAHPGSRHVQSLQPLADTASP